MGAMRRVLEWGMQRRGYFRVEENATEGATIGKDVLDSDGNIWDPETVVTEVITEIEEAVPPNQSGYTAIWKYILYIPINISSLDPGITPIDSAYTVLRTDYTVNATSGTFALEILSAVGLAGKVFNLKNSGTGVITLVNVLSETIDDNVSGTLKLVQYENLQIQSDGANWIIL